MKILRYAAIAAACASALWVTIYISAINGRPFKAAARAIIASSSFTQRHGRVLSVSLDPFGGYEDTVSLNSDDSAQMSLWVKTEAGKFTIEVTLRGSAGDWKIVRVVEEGAEIPI